MYFTWFNFALGGMGVAFGAWVTIYAYHINHQIWYFSWAERKLGPGMGTIAYRWVGVVLAIFFFLVMIGQINLTGAGGVQPGSNRINTTTNPGIPSGSNVQIAP
jgi:hypothetical protein